MWCRRASAGVAGKAVTATQMVGAPLTVAAMMHAMPGSTIFAGSAAAPMVGPTMVTFLQMFPPIAAQVRSPADGPGRNRWTAVA